jgi:hypothetical protein
MKLKRLITVTCLSLALVLTVWAAPRQQPISHIGAAGPTASAFGEVIYVDVTNGGDTNGGKTPESAVATLAQAMTNSAAGDTIIFAPGTYPVDVSAASVAPKANQLWRAARPSFGGAPSVVIVADADDGANSPVAVDVNGVVFQDIEFKLVAGGTTALYCIDAAQTTAVRGLVFDNCWFNLNSVEAASGYACKFDHATNAITGMVMKNCRFVGGDAETNQSIYIQVGVGGIPDALIENCVFALESTDDDAIAINFLDPEAPLKSYAFVVRNNDFIGAAATNDTTVPIVFAGAMTEDEIAGVIRTNYFAHCGASSVTVDKMNAGVIWNYYGDDATGGTLADPGT